MYTHNDDIMFFIEFGRKSRKVYWKYTCTKLARYVDVYTSTKLFALAQYFLENIFGYWLVIVATITS